MIKIIFVFLFIILVNGQCTECYHQSRCIGNECDCKTNPFFRNTNTIKNCTALSCLNGIGPDSLNRCRCREGWGGLACTQCEMDRVCEKTCYKGFDTRSKKTSTCKVLGEEIIELLGNITTFTISNTNEKIEIWYQMWDVQKTGRQVETFECTMNNCEFKRFSDRNRYDCKNTSCRCIVGSKKCEDENLRFIINNMKNDMSLTCLNNSNKCEFNQREFPGEIPFECSHSECLNK
jgi:hypothetical protein